MGSEHRRGATLSEAEPLCETPDAQAGKIKDMTSLKDGKGAVVGSGGFSFCSAVMYDRYKCGDIETVLHPLLHSTAFPWPVGLSLCDFTSV